VGTRTIWGGDGIAHAYGKNDVVARPTTEVGTVFAHRGSPLVSAGAHAEADALALEARQAYVEGEYRRAVAVADRALAKEPQHRLATHIVAAASCKLRDRGRAARAYV